MCVALWNLLSDVPILKKVWKDKEKHKLASRIAQLLIEDDYSWYHASASGYRSEKERGPGEDHESKIPIFNATVGVTRNDIQKIVQEVIEAEDSIRKKKGHKDETNESPLFGATRHGIGHKDETNESPLFVATRHGIEEIVAEIITKNPNGLELVNDEEQNILHLAVLHRKKKIFVYVLRMTMSNTHLTLRLSKKIDKNGYTLLHQAADTKYYTGGTGQGPALKPNEEWEWFNDVKDLVPIDYAMRCDKNNEMTAEQLFEKNHESLLKEAQEWIKGTCQSCSTIAILIAGAVFAAAFAVPGGLDDNGFPHFLCSIYFMVFATMDVVSLASALSSVVLPLSVATSSLEFKDFYRSIPRKLSLGFSFLFFSVVTTMAAFGAAVVIFLNSQKIWTEWLVYFAAFCPIILFTMGHFRMYVHFWTILVQYLQEIVVSITPPKAKGILKRAIHQLPL